jgi:hypothetical protein
MSVPESRARLGYLLSEMLSLPNLPSDLHQAVTTHLQQQLTVVNLLNPEYCLRLYPVLAELAELKARSESTFTQDEVFIAETLIEETEPEITMETSSEDTAVETSSDDVKTDAAEEPQVAQEEVAAEPSVEAEAQQDESAESLAENMPMAAIAESANAAVNPRTLW